MGLLLRNTIRKMKHSLGRFISLVAIILIGVGFYAGVRQTTPAILSAENSFIEEQNMMDLHLAGTLGFSDKDIDELKNLKSVDKVTGGYSEYVYSGERIIRVISIDNKINDYLLWEGDFPVRDNECLGDAKFYKVGDKVTVREPSNDEGVDYLLEHEFTVTGTITSPLYMGYEYGSANIGNGELTSYILVRDGAFDYSSYTDLYITMKKGEEDTAYTEAYDKKLNQLISEVEGIQKDRQKAREEELYTETENKVYQMIYSELFDDILGDEEGEAANQEKARTTISLMVNGVVNPDNDIESIIDKELNDEEREALEKAKEEAFAEIEIPECKWFLQTRDDIVSNYKVLKDQYEEVNALADIIPFFFVIIVFLMTSNTMSRMIAEERGELGTFTSLGFSNKYIIGGYMMYVLTATVIGSVAGYFFGVLLIPDFIYGCFPLAIGDISFSFNWVMFVGEVLVAFLVMTAVSIYSCMMTLREKPAYLLRPAEIKSGRKILLERLGAVWTKMTFSWKTTIRNLSRNNRRVLMTVIGVGGCTFLMFIGFALRDCISHVGDKQFSELHHYDIMVIYDEDERPEGIDDIVESPLMLRQEMMKVENEDNHSLDIFLMVIDMGSSHFEEYYTLRQADPRDIKVDDLDIDALPEKGEKLKCSDKGVIITPKIAEVVGRSVGDEIVLLADNGKEYSVRIDGIAENYVSNYVYMPDTLYENIMGREVKYNTIIAGSGDKNLDVLCESLYAIDSVVNVTTTERVLKKANDGVDGLEGIVALLVAISSVLAFTVIYNLTAIGISERTREIATLKVLGFTPFETNDYIYREIIIGAIAGIIAGLLVSPFLLGKVIDLIGVDNLIFLRQCKPQSYIYAVILSLVFTLLMTIPTYLKLNSINMIESIKSVD